MNIGREIVACALRTGTLKPFIDAGVTGEWLTDQVDLSRAAVFGADDVTAYHTLLRHWNGHGKLPSLDMFRLSHPDVSYRLPDTSYTPDELTEVFLEDRKRYLTQMSSIEIAELVGAGDSDGALALMEQAARVIRASRRSGGIAMVWDAIQYDADGRIKRKTEPGVALGIPEVDDRFAGFQNGNLITLLGRAKAGKTSFLIKSALQAFLGGDRIARRVMIVTVEISADSVGDRLDAFGAGINMLDYASGRLANPANKFQADKLRTFRRDKVEGYGGGNMYIIQPAGAYTVTDLEYDIDQYQPDVVYVDGFYFLVDRLTGKNGGAWEGHDNIARELKELAMRRDIPVITSHQVREKQLTGKKGAGIDDGAMMGGTGLIMASDMVIGIDADDNPDDREKIHTISCTRSRTGYFRSVKGTWDWKTSAFTVRAEPESIDESKYGYGKEDHGDS
jgi:DnaB-like helicase C terminal domain